MRYVIIGDLHGNKPNIFVKEFDAIIAPGDFCSDAPRKYMFEALRRSMTDASDDVEWYDIVGKKKARQMIQKSISDGRKILEYLNSFDVPIYAVPGNWDWTGHGYDWAPTAKNYWSRLLRNLTNIIDCHHRLVQGTEVQFIGHGIISGPEFPSTRKTRSEYDTKELRAMYHKYVQQYKIVDRLFERAKKCDKPIIFIPHNVPYNTPIDMIDNPQSPRHGQHFGSLIAKQMCIAHQPKICVGGHMHEHFRACKIGKTTAINAGFGSDVNVLLEQNGERIRKLEFRRGGRKFV